MHQPPLPGFDSLVKHWRAEHLRRLVASVMVGLCFGLFLLLLAVMVFSFSLSLGWGLAFGLLLLWLVAAGILLGVSCRRPALPVLAKRADAVLQLPDDLLSLLELPEDADEWRKVSWQKTRDQLAATDLSQAWPLPWPRRAIVAASVAGVLTLAVIGVGWNKLQIETQRLATERAVQAERLAVAEEVLEDWKAFAETTDDPELKKLFAEAGELKTALQDNDPRAALLEMNQIEARMSALEATIASESIASQATQMAEALEAFEGMGAMSAALRNQNFQAAAEEAAQLAAELKRDPQGKKDLRREAVAAEMLAAESAEAGKRGNSSLSKALDQMAEAAQSAKGSVPNSQLGEPTQSLRDQFSQEAARKNRGQTAQTGKQQLDALRRRLQGEDAKDAPIAQLGKSPGKESGDEAKEGQQAGTSPGGDPRGDLMHLLDPAGPESVTGQLGEGESETRTLSATSGSGTAAAATKTLAMPDYVELSQQAVADENLPLAHRRVIRTYFERIRPTPETQTP